MINFACPRCGAGLPHWEGGSQACANCGSTYEAREGIYRFLLPERVTELRPFLEQYAGVRAQEGYHALEPSAYHLLPRVSPNDPHAAMWRIRRETYEALRARVLSKYNCSRLEILDLGAGNGWLSNRLTEMGNNCTAVDLSVDAHDGLAAHLYFSSTFLCVQAEFDRLPFLPAQFDIVVFNASLHYSPDIGATLRGARRMLVPGGVLAIMDSPTFHSTPSGQKMRVELEASLRAKYGLDHFVSIGTGYLTENVLTATGMNFSFTPSKGDPFWRVRRKIAGWRKRREPASFGLWVGSESHA